MKVIYKVTHLRSDQKYSTDEKKKKCITMKCMSHNIITPHYYLILWCLLVITDIWWKKNCWFQTLQRGKTNLPLKINYMYFYIQLTLPVYYINLISHNRLLKTEDVLLLNWHSNGLTVIFLRKNNQSHCRKWYYCDFGSELTSF